MSALADLVAMQDFVSTLCVDTLDSLPAPSASSLVLQSYLQLLQLDASAICELQAWKLNKHAPTFVLLTCTVVPIWSQTLVLVGMLCWQVAYGVLVVRAGVQQHECHIG